MLRSPLARRGRGMVSGWLAGQARRRGIRILRYHGVVERRTDRVLHRNQHTIASFREQVAYLSRFRLLSLDELLAELALPERSGTARAAAAITFDDGFANNVAAAEILSARRIPWMLFVPSGEIASPGTARAMWLVALSLWLLAGRETRIESLGSVWPLGSREDRERAFRRIRTGLKALSAADRRREMDAIAGQLPAGEAERLAAEHPSLRIVDEAELRALAAAGAEIGSHGVHHEMHHEAQPREVRERELTDSKARLEELLQRPCRAFAFPNGDILQDSPDEAARAGYLAAFTTREASAIPGAPLHALPRIEAPGSLERFVRVFSFEASPAIPGSDTAAAPTSRSGDRDEPLAHSPRGSR